MKDRSNMIWIDLEMTGLDTQRDYIIEIASIVTDKNLNILEGMDLIVSEKARAQGVTTKVSIVATVRPTTRDPAICSQKLVM